MYDISKYRLVRRKEYYPAVIPQNESLWFYSDSLRLQTLYLGSVIALLMGMYSHEE